MVRKASRDRLITRKGVSLYIYPQDGNIHLSIVDEPQKWWRIIPVGEAEDIWVMSDTRSRRTGDKLTLEGLEAEIDELVDEWLELQKEQARAENLVACLIEDA